jgi:hypothetical protein
MKLQSKYYQAVLETLAGLHPRPAEAEMVTRSIGMQPEKTQLTGTGLVVWDSVLSLAEKEGKVKDLLDFTASKNPGNTGIKTLLQTLEGETAFIKHISYADYIKPPSATTVKIFVAYDPEDSAEVKPLKTQLRILEKTGKISIFDMHTHVTGGADKQKEWLQNSGDADAMLLMISADFLANDGCMELAFAGVDMRKRVVPVLLSSCMWSRIEILENIVPLPTNGVPVSKWPDKDEAMFEVASGVEALVLSIQKGKN